MRYIPDAKSPWGSPSTSSGLEAAAAIAAAVAVAVAVAVQATAPEAAARQQAWLGLTLCSQQAAVHVPDTPVSGKLVGISGHLWLLA